MNVSSIAVYNIYYGVSVPYTVVRAGINGTTMPSPVDFCGYVLVQIFDEL